jgi:signal peptidase I
MEEPEKKSEDQPESCSLWVPGESRRWIRDIFFAAITAILIVVFVVQPVRVEGTSMQPNLVNQERIFVNKFLYRFSEVQRQDVVVFWYPKDRKKSFIKRVIGLPGDIVEVRGSTVYVNGNQLQEEYARTDSRDYRTYPSVTVPEDSYYVMGDHRSSSNDSRHWGCVPAEFIFGRAIFRYWPIPKIGLLD